MNAFSFRVPWPPVKLALLLVFLPLLSYHPSMGETSVTPVQADSCTTTVDTPRLTPDPPVCGQSTRVTVRLTDHCAVLEAYLGFSGPPDWSFHWVIMSRASGDRYDGYWTQDMSAFAGGGQVIYVIRVRRGDGSEFTSGEFLSYVSPCNPVSTVEVTPKLVVLDPGDTRQFTARALDASGNEMDKQTIRWSVATGGGTITSTGLFTAGSALNTFPDTVRAETTTTKWVFDGENWAYRDVAIAGFSTVMVTHTVNRVEVIPSAATVSAGGSQKFTARVFDSADQEISGLPIEWSVVNGGGTISRDGVFAAGNAQGSFSSTVAAEAWRDGISVTGNADVTVVAPCTGWTPQPDTYSGNIIVGFTAAPDGAKIVARIDDYTSAAVTVKDGKYSNLIVAPPCSSYQGRPVKFYVDGVQTNESALFLSNNARSFDFTVGSGSKISLNKGWNLISLPTPQQDSSPAAVFADSELVTRAFTIENGNWTYAWRLPGQSWTGSLTTIVDGRGYWLFAEDATTLTLKPAALASSAPSSNYTLSKGWNLVGYSSFGGAAQAPVASYLKGLNWQAIYRYSASSGYDVARPDGTGFDTVEAGQGYYVLVDRSPSVYDSEFDTSTLPANWTWLGEDAAHWSLTAKPGKLQVATQEGNMPVGAEGPPHNILIETPPAADFAMVASVAIDPRENFQQAGLVVYGSQSAFVKLVRVFVGGRQLVSLGSATSGWGDFVEASANFTGSDVYLKIEKSGTTFKGYLSADGAAWTALGSRDLPALKDFKIGVVAFKGPTSAAEINAEFDYFRVYDKSLTWTVY